MTTALDWRAALSRNATASDGPCKHFVVILTAEKALTAGPRAERRAHVCQPPQVNHRGYYEAHRGASMGTGRDRFVPLRRAVARAKPQGKTPFAAEEFVGLA